jgi:peroxiredoxin family protein
MADKLSIILYSGTVDKLLPVAILTSGAVTMDMDVDLFVTFYGIHAFSKEGVKTNKRFSKDFEEMAPMITQKLREKKVPSWYDMLKEAKASGHVKIHACSTACDLLDVKKENLDPIVDDIVGIGNYLSEASESKITLFI